MRTQFFRFILIGFSNTAIDFVLYFVLTRLLGVYFLGANVLSYIAGMTWSFFWNKHWTFRDRQAHYGRQYITFFLVNVVAFALSQAILFFVVTRLYWPDLWGKALAVTVGIVWSFTAHRLWTFRSSTFRSSLTFFS